MKHFLLLICLTGAAVLPLNGCDNEVTMIRIQFPDVQSVTLLPFPQHPDGTRIVQSGQDVRIPESVIQAVRFFEGDYVEVHPANPKALQVIGRLSAIVDGQTQTVDLLWQSQTPLLLRISERIYIRRVEHPDTIRPDEPMMLYGSLARYHSSGSATEAFGTLLQYVAKTTNK